MAEVTVVNTDEEFMDEMGKIKKLLDIETIDELKPTVTSMLRGKIMSVLKYVMDQIKAEEASEEQQSTEEAEGEGEGEGEETTSGVPSAQAAPVAPVAAPLPGLGSSMSFGGRTGKKGRKQKGGWGVPIDMARITNTTEGGLNSTKDPYSAISGTADVDISANLHKAFTAGNSKGFSSVGGLPASELNTMLPAYGTAQAGGAKKKRTYKKKN